MKIIYTLLIFVCFSSCSQDSNDADQQDDPIVEEQEMKSLEEIQKKDNERLDSFKKANGITD